MQQNWQQLKLGLIQSLLQHYELLNTSTFLTSLKLTNVLFMADNLALFSISYSKRCLRAGERLRHINIYIYSIYGCRPSKGPFICKN